MFIECYLNCIVYSLRKCKGFKKKNDVHKGDKYLIFFKLHLIGFLYCTAVHNSAHCICKNMRVILYANLYILDKATWNPTSIMLTSYVLKAYRIRARVKRHGMYLIISLSILWHFLVLCSFLIFFLVRLICVLLLFKVWNDMKYVYKDVACSCANLE